MGCDRSSNLCSICSDRGFNVFVSDCLSVPVRTACVDVAISIAVIHHMSTQERRLAALKELVRVLRPGGRALVYVWAKEQKLDNKKSKYVKDSKHPDVEVSNSIVCKPGSKDTDNTRVLSVHVNRTEFQSSDLLVPWHLRDKQSESSSKPVFHRYYHVFAQGELEALCSELTNVDVTQSYYDQGNWCVELTKH